MTSTETDAQSRGRDAATNRSRTTVYLHVGEPKTGTTFLQQVMWRNRGELAQQGVLLPGHGLQDHFRANQDLREVQQAAGDPAGSWSGEWEVLAKQALRTKGTAVISHELLAGADADQARRAVSSLEAADVHVVLTVRDFGTLLPAEWQETVKHRNQQGWEDWLADIIDKQSTSRRERWFWRVHDSLDLLSRWSPPVPPDRVHVITVPRRGSAPNLLWDRFAALIGVDPSSVDTSRARPNASLGVPEAELIRRVNQSLPKKIPNWFYAGRVKETLAHQVLASRPTVGRLQLPTEREQWAHEEASRLIDGLRVSGYDIIGDLDELRPTPASQAGLHPDDVTAEAMLDAAVDSIVALVADGYRRTQPAPRPKGSVVQRAKAAARSSPRVKRTVRRLSSRHGSVRRLRVLAWWAAKRARAWRDA